MIIKIQKKIKVYEKSCGVICFLLIFLLVFLVAGCKKENNLKIYLPDLITVSDDGNSLVVFSKTNQILDLYIINKGYKRIRFDLKNLLNTAGENFLPDCRSLIIINQFVYLDILIKEWEHEKYIGLLECNAITKKSAFFRTDLIPVSNSGSEYAVFYSSEKLEVFKKSEFKGIGSLKKKSTSLYREYSFLPFRKLLNFKNFVVHGFWDETQVAVISTAGKYFLVDFGEQALIPLEIEGDTIRFLSCNSQEETLTVFTHSGVLYSYAMRENTWKPGKGYGFFTDIIVFPLTRENGFFIVSKKSETKNRNSVSIVSMEKNIRRFDLSGSADYFSSIFYDEKNSLLFVGLLNRILIIDCVTNKEIKTINLLEQD